MTEQFFQEAGIGTGQRVLDVGSGVGDVAMIAARLVGPSGEVVAIERDGRTVRRARERAKDAGIRNIHFAQIDIDDFVSDTLFDAVVGRYILQFMTDPVAVLSSLAACLRPGGVVAFQEGSWLPFIALSWHLPLYSACVSLLHEAGARSGVKLELGPALHKVYVDAGLPAPDMRLEMKLGCEPGYTRLLSDAIRSVLPHIKEHGLPLDAIGELETLQQRLQDEVAHSNTVVPWIALVGAWSRTPAA